MTNPAKTLAAICLLIAVITPAWAQQQSDTRRPNILFILVDDLKPTIGVYGDEHAITPNIDALANRGMRFDLAYCNQAVCAPSRFNLMLGSRSTSTGLYNFGRDLRDFAPDAVTMPQYFRRFGYKAVSMGKVYHIGHNVHGDDASWSVPHHGDKVVEYLLPESTDGGQLTREEALFTNQIPQGGVGRLPRGAAWEAPDVEDDAYADGRTAAYAIEQLKAAKQDLDTPFFMAVGIARPHLPFSAPKKYWDLFDPATLPMPQTHELPELAPEYAGKRGGEINAYKPVPANIDSQDYPEELERQLIHGYYASTAYADAQIGKVIDALDELGLADNTIIVLWGDHGWHLGDHGMWTKHTNYEQANRIPLLIVAPGVTTPGSHTNQLAETVDLYPTLADLAGLPLPGSSGAPAVPQPIDGESLVPVLRDPAARVSEYAYHCYPRGGGRMGRAIRTERYRLVEWKRPGASPDTADYELYDYEEDPLETINLADDRPQVVERLKALLSREPEAK